MVLKPVRPNWIDRRCRMRDRRDASIIKNNISLKRMGTGKGNWGTELDAQMMFEKFGMDMEMETAEVGPEIIAMTSFELQPEKVITDAAAADKEEPKEVPVRRNSKGYQILEFPRNFELRASQNKTEASKENKDPAMAEPKVEEALENEAAAEKKASGAEAKVSAKMPDTKELWKAAVLRFKKKGPAWGIALTGDAKEVKSSPIKEELEKSQSKGK